MENITENPNTQVLNVALKSSASLSGINNPKLRKLATSIKQGESKAPSAGHLNYFKTTSSNN
jgi:indole-3-glycerol phosphate synthase